MKDLNKFYMYKARLWTSINGDCKTNSTVENWFKHLKNSLTKHKLCSPASFIRKIWTSISNRSVL